ncbi:hypothetical protein RUND412_010174, partial [Rhizina undulata]
MARRIRYGDLCYIRFAEESADGDVPLLLNEVVDTIFPSGSAYTDAPIYISPEEVIRYFTSPVLPDPSPPQESYFEAFYGTKSQSPLPQTPRKPSSVTGNSEPDRWYDGDPGPSNRPTPANQPISRAEAKGKAPARGIILNKAKTSKRTTELKEKGAREVYKDNGGFLNIPFVNLF